MPSLDENASNSVGSETLPRTLGATTALCVVVGSVIGSGIFLVPAVVAKEVPSIAGIVALWIVGGLFSFAGALTLAELAAMLPRAGGPYVYLREAYGRLPAFLFGWTEFLIIRAGSVATLASAFAIYASQPQLFPAPKAIDPRIWQMLLACGAMIAVAVINVVGTRASGWVQVVGTVLKLGALATMMILPFVLGKASVSNLSPMWPSQVDGSLFAGFMAAMVSVLWAYDGWVNAASLAEEIHDPGRNVPRALGFGMLILMITYLGMTLVYHLVLPMETIAAGSDTKGSGKEVAAIFCKTLLGDRGALAIALVVVCSTLISLNGNALSGPRAYFAMARDGLFPKALCRIHPRFQTPANAILAQAVWSILLMVAATTFLLVEPPKTATLPSFAHNAWVEFHKRPIYNVLLTYVIFGGTVLYTLTAASVFVLRWTRPNLPRPYRVWGYPVTTLLYLAASSLLIYDLLSSKKSQFVALGGLGIILAGVPAYFLFSLRSRNRRPFDSEVPPA
jgi:APA family basic amino acid/polyamine antiporter